MAPSRFELYSLEDTPVDASVHHAVDEASSSAPRVSSLLLLFTAAMVIALLLPWWWRCCFRRPRSPRAGDGACDRAGYAEAWGEKCLHFSPTLKRLVEARRAAASRRHGWAVARESPSLSADGAMQPAQSVGGGWRPTLSLPALGRAPGLQSCGSSDGLMEGDPTPTLTPERAAAELGEMEGEIQLEGTPHSRTLLMAPGHESSFLTPLTPSTGGGMYVDARSPDKQGSPSAQRGSGGANTPGAEPAKADELRRRLSMELRPMRCTPPSWGSGVGSCVSSSMGGQGHAPPHAPPAVVEGAGAAGGAARHGRVETHSSGESEDSEVSRTDPQALDTQCAIALK